MDINDFQLIPTNAGPKKLQDLCGWAAKDDPRLLQEAFSMFGEDFPQLHIVGSRPTAGGRSMLWEIARKVIGKDTDNYPQQVGDCCSFGSKNAIEYMQFYPIMNGEKEAWTSIFPPYLYGCARVFIGNGRLGNGDGSLGIWQAKGVMNYGTIPNSTHGCPQYSGSVARQWGRSGPPENFISMGKQHLVKSAAQVKTWDDLLTALMNGYPVIVASDVGFDMNPRNDGFNHYSTHWGHCMCFIGIDDGDGSRIEPHACLLNSWGNVFGRITDFRSGEQWPIGTMRIRKADAETMLSQNDSFAFSSLQGFPAQDISRDFFDVI